MFLKPPPGVDAATLPAAAPSRMPAASAIALALALIAPFLLYWQTAASMVAIWNSSETFAHGYVWHEATMVWQTAGAGEKAVAYWLDMGASALATSFESLGMTQPTASILAEAFDAAMGQSILNLYRSAGQAVLAQWTAELPSASARPGLAVFAPGDIWSGGEAMHRWTAERTGAEVVVLDGLGHWWLLEDPAAGAAVLQAFWNEL